MKSDQVRQQQEACRLRWEALKTRGHYTVAEITGIDNDTPWSEREPLWWLDMMAVKRKIQTDLMKDNDRV